MSIQNVIKTKDNCTPLYRGTPGSATTSLGEASHASYDSESRGTHKGTVWLEGRLFTVYRYGTTSSRCTRYDFGTSLWTDNGAAIGGTSFGYALHQVIANKDRIYAFYDQSGPANAAYGTHIMACSIFLTDMSTEYRYGIAGYTGVYDKSINAYQDLNHVYDLNVHKGAIYIAGAFGIYTHALSESTDITVSKYWEIAETGAGGRPLADNQTTKSFSNFQNNSLYCLFGNGTVNKIGGVFSEEADLNDTISGGSGIVTGTDITGAATVLSDGYGCYIHQSGNYLHAFLNASGVSGTGVVSFASEDGTNWVQTTQYVVPLAWRSQIAHIKGCMDPSNNEQRIVLLNATNESAFEEFVFNGSGAEMTALGSSSITDFRTYNFWNDSAIDVESETEPDIGLTEVTATYKLYSEHGDTATVTPKYSINNGGSWHEATKKAGQGSGLTGLVTDTFANGGVEYTFVWDYRADLGYGTDYTNVKLQFITSVE